MTKTKIQQANILKNAEEYCHLHGKRLTPIRKQVLAIILASNDLIKAYDILNELQKIRSNATPPTVYRAIDFLVEMRILHKAESLNAFLFCSHFGDQHTGIITTCKQCGKTQEIIDQSFTTSVSQFVKNNHLHLSNDPLVISVICQHCSGVQ